MTLTHVLKPAAAMSIASQARQMVRSTQILLALMAAFGLHAAHSACPDLHESFDVQIPLAPSPIAIDGREWLIYELHITNFSRDVLRLREIDVLSGADSRLVHSYQGREEIGAQLGRPYLSSDVNDDVVPPGQQVILYVEVPEPSEHTMTSLMHRIAYATLDDKTTCSFTSSMIAVIAPRELALGPPLHGGPWAAIYDWRWPRGHRRVFYTIGGRARLPGRFAIDWVKLDDAGHQARGDADSVKNAFGYGADVLAVADARVAEVRVGVKESELISANPDHALADAPGNYVALDIGDGRFAIYEHLQPNSIRVSRGDHVHRGQVIASLGFTGDSTGPHLHFHVADTPFPLQGEGVPFVFEQFRLLGHYEDVARLGSSKWDNRAERQSEIHSRERPGPNAVIVFDAETSKH